MRPIIGITADIKNGKLTLPTEDIQAITAFGGVPIVLPNIRGDDEIEVIAEILDGLLLTGGTDIDPTLFGEEPKYKLGTIVPERDAFEMALIPKMLERNKPILGICRGIQIINIAVGGDMYQDIYAQTDIELIQHTQNAPHAHPTHFVEVKKGSLLERIVQTNKFKVNSFHHQAIRKIPSGFDISARTSDGIIEAFESTNHKFVLGVQWHPERLFVKDDIFAGSIFKAFLTACEN